MTAQAVARQMVRLRCKGSIVLIASMSGTVANRGLICPAYNASKAAVIQLARNLASEWGEHNIRVNTISPGYIVTAMVEALFETYPERRDEWPKHNMLGRLSAPEEYRGAAVFLLSDASSFMTGADLRMDGGHAACAPEEYRGAAVFLLSDASSFMTGADLRMDGGHAAW
ncbi:hypothetical protein HYQ46_012225 [Verticillium longisporum]|nr:hypothetical protein HYQ46_012225 [Verticillium longisporum]